MAAGHAREGAGCGLWAALTCSSAQSSLMSHSGLSGPDSAVGLAKVGKGLANCVCCFNRMFFFCSFPSRLIFNMPGVARSNSERGGTTGSPWRCFFFLPATGQRAFLSEAVTEKTAFASEETGTRRTTGEAQHEGASVETNLLSCFYTKRTVSTKLPPCPRAQSNQTRKPGRGVRT